MSVKGLASYTLSGLAATLAIGLACLGSSGCGGDSTGQQAAEISPEMQKQTSEMLSNYGKNYHQEKRVAKKKKSQ